MLKKATGSDLRAEKRPGPALCDQPPLKRPLRPSMRIRDALMEAVFVQWVPSLTLVLRFLGREHWGPLASVNRRTRGVWLSDALSSCRVAPCLGQQLPLLYRSVLSRSSAANVEFLRDTPNDLIRRFLNTAGEGTLRKLSVSSPDFCSFETWIDGNPRAGIALRGLHELVLKRQFVDNPKDLTDSLLAALRWANKIRALRVDEDPRCPERPVIENILRVTPSTVEELHFTNFDILTHRLEPLRDCFASRTLRRLTLSGCSLLRESDIASLFFPENCLTEYLEHLDLSGTAVGTHALCSVGTSCRHLVELSISAITTEGIVAFADRETNRVFWPQFLMAISETFVRPHPLRIFRMENIDSEPCFPLNWILALFPSVEHLFVTGNLILSRQFNDWHEDVPFPPLEPSFDEIQEAHDKWKHDDQIFCSCQVCHRIMEVRTILGIPFDKMSKPVEKSHPTVPQTQARRGLGRRNARRPSPMPPAVQHSDRQQTSSRCHRRPMGAPPLILWGICLKEVDARRTMLDVPHGQLLSQLTRIRRWFRYFNGAGNHADFVHIESIGENAQVRVTPDSLLRC